jgi:UDP-2-acetamido-2,6-beta-L-arabino-hexul-4-ose reductase
MKIVVTGAQGFIGKNLCFSIREEGHEVLEVHRKTTKEELGFYLSQADFVFHLAGINRPKNISEFQEGNVDLTQLVVDFLIKSNNPVPVVFTSSIQTHNDNHYGTTKFLAEKVVEEYSKITGAPNYVFRLPNVFGKWCKPNYNSFIATFCHNIASGEEIRVDDPSSKVSLVYIDDLCEAFIDLIQRRPLSGFCSIPVEYQTTVGEVAEMLFAFKSFRDTLISKRVGLGLNRALYATFLSYMRPRDFNYSIPKYSDNRGVFCEVLKTKDSGQFSYFTARPGITRGGHYHHTKNEKFLVIKGIAKFKFENILSGERHSLTVDGGNPEIVETVPGWSHDITNVGDEELIVMLWANEIFDQERPDTFKKELL